jgi:hypothetical protein
MDRMPPQDGGDVPAWEQDVQAFTPVLLPDRKEAVWGPGGSPPGGNGAEPNHNPPP